METLRNYQVNLLKSVSNSFFRTLYHQMNWNQRMIGIKGLRGVGKTTLLLQYLKYNLKTPGTALYATLDHPWFYTNTLFDLAELFNNIGGRLLLLDEIHKYANWSRDLKLIYDGFPEIQIIFTASSALEIQKGESDLSRRVSTYEMPGMSFREYLVLNNSSSLPVFDFEDILHSHFEIASEIVSKIKPLPLFKEYLIRGYLPFGNRETTASYLPKIHAIINQVVDVDLSFAEGLTTTSKLKMKQLLGIISESPPFQPNISSLARKMGLGRDTINNFIQNLAKAKIINLVNKETKGVAALQKPDKIYLENTNFNFALNENPNIGNLRETVFLNQLINSRKAVRLPKKGDFIVGEHTIEVGGKSKTLAQIRDVPNSWIAADDIEVGFERKIPLWLFGLMY